MKVKFKVRGSLKNSDSLRKLKKEAEETTAKVGVFSGTTRQTSGKGKTISAVELAMIHEFGTSKTPQRSFINATVKEKETEIVDFMQKTLDKTGSVKQTVELTSIFIEALIKDDAFRTSGFGKWKPLKQSTIKRKTTKSGVVRGGILRDTGQMRRSIVSKMMGK